jgi:hypothetical protein
MGRLQVLAKKRLLIMLGLSIAVCALVAWDVQYILSTREETFPEAPMDEFIGERHLFPQPPVTEVPVRSVREAWDLLKPDDLVLGVTVGNEARAYPLNVFEEEPARKILNDTLAGQPILASFCDNCHNGIVYDRIVNGQALTFGVDGRLWKESMVMYDEQTQSRWSHMTGVAKRGKLRGAVLKSLPSVMTDWQTWRSHHADGTVVVLPATHHEFVRGYYGDLKDYVLGVAGDGASSRFWSLDSLARTPVQNDHWQGEPVLVLFVPRSVTAHLYSRRVETRVLTFREENAKLVDEETGSSWEPVTGQAEAGPLAGKRLRAIEGAKLSKRRAWELHYSQ